jgi:hypothetical protein
MKSQRNSLTEFACAAFAMAALLTVPTAQPSRGQAGAAPGVCVVQIKTRTGQVLGTAGKGFAANVAGRNVLVTTAHGLSQLMGSEDTEANLANLGTLTMMNLAGQEIGNAGECVLHGSQGLDLLMFDLPAGGMQSFSMAPESPAIGTHIWVLSKNGQNFSGTNGVDRFAGTVVQSLPGSFGARMETPLTAMHSSGSPVVDEHNNVVGMLTGVSSNRGLIEGIPATAITQSLNPHAQVSRPKSAAAAGAPISQARSNGVQNYRSGVQSYGNGVHTYGTLAPKVRNKP